MTIQGARGQHVILSLCEKGDNFLCTYKLIFKYLLFINFLLKKLITVQISVLHNICFLKFSL